MINAYIALGSNQKSPKTQITQAISALAQLPHCTIIKQSPCYESTPWGHVTQENFINAAVLVQTTLSATSLLEKLQAIENHQGRERNLFWGPRTIDLDLILYGDHIIQMPRLEVPHPFALQRDFVLRPLLDLTPNLVFPCGTAAFQALESIENKSRSLIFK
jgi:2-amino-4-hydroxy-6-hydroxymethyldihydropteridine diphosphokinase